MVTDVLYYSFIKINLSGEVASGFLITGGALPQGQRPLADAHTRRECPRLTHLPRGGG